MKTLFSFFFPQIAMPEMTAKACSKPGSSTTKRHMQNQDFQQNPPYFQGLSHLENIEVWEKD